VALIKASANVEAARQGLMATFGLSEIQANAILEMRLSRSPASSGRRSRTSISR
jgi:Type IIA topoisomerase (DNA gyrase/topo II, topoisomerase IV), A subunit